MDWIITKKGYTASDSTDAMLKSRGQAIVIDGTESIEWGDWGSDKSNDLPDLTEKDVIALKKSHHPYSVDYLRAKRVKLEMQRGGSLDHIAKALRSQYGHKYSRSSIAKCYTALSKKKSTKFQSKF